jgi:hypothetical protein
MRHYWPDDSAIGWNKDEFKDYAVILGYPGEGPPHYILAGESNLVVHFQINGIVADI